jgi:DNA sulfur modification protein DndB
MAKSIVKTINVPISLPCLRGRMGDWFYYVTVLPFDEVKNRVSLPEEIDEKYSSDDLVLGDWIQRKIEKGRIQNIAEYLRIQPQRFFNSLILGIFGGNPLWQEVSLNYNQTYSEVEISEDRLDYFSRTLGVLNLNGNEDIFAIDGQHRVMGIRSAIKSSNLFQEDEIPVIFVAHKTDTEGTIRTRRLFSTLNRYAKPVNPSEIIALSEDNNCSIITRFFVDSYPLFSGKILVQKNRSINHDNTSAFTNIMTFNDIVERIVTDDKVQGIPVKGKNKNKYITNREDEKSLNIDIELVKNLFDNIIGAVPSIKKYFEIGYVDRKSKTTNLFFRPIGQNVIFDVLKIAEPHNAVDKALSFFAKDDFNLEHKVWNTVFWGADTDVMLTEPIRQKYAVQMIMEKIGIKAIRTPKDDEFYKNLKFGINDI